MIFAQDRSSAVRAASVCAALLAAAAVSGTAQAEQYAKSYTISSRASVHVDTNDGSVRVTTGDTQQVEFHVEFMGYELDKTLRIESNQQGDEVTLTARIVNHVGFFLGNRRLHIEVRMPKDADLKVQTGDGSVEASGLNGNIFLHTGDGSIKANALSGSIDLHSGDGSLTVDSLAGVVRLHTGDGAIDGNDLDGKFVAESGDGRIRLAGRFDALKVHSGDGSIDMSALQGSKLDTGWDISTGSGSVDLTLPGTLQLDIDATTGDGRINFDIPVTVQGMISKSRVHGTMNGGGQILTIHTGDGSIHLKRA
jgi:DUF4097 and DUF4098 domain-containing protein YvlB